MFFFSLFSLGCSNGVIFSVYLPPSTRGSTASYCSVRGEVQAPTGTLRRAGPRRDCGAGLGGQALHQGSAETTLARRTGGGAPLILSGGASLDATVRG